MNEASVVSLEAADAVPGWRDKVVGPGSIVQEVTTDELLGCQVATARLGPLWPVHRHLAENDHVASETAGLVGVKVGPPDCDLDLLADIAVAEAVERYTLLGWPGHTFGRPGADGHEQWVQGIDLLTDTEVWVPAASVYLYPPPGSRPAAGWPRTSSGVAVHGCDTAAIDGALLELIERDVTSTIWQRRVPVPVLATADLPVADSLRGQLESAGLRCTLHHVERFPGVHAVLAVGRTDSVLRSTTLGAAASRSLSGAAVKAMLECVGVLHALRRIRSGRPVGASLSGAHELAHADWAWAFDFLAQAGCSTGDRGSAGDLIGVLRDAGLTAIGVPLISEALSLSGLAGWRVMVPGLRPLTYEPAPHQLPNPFG